MLTGSISPFKPRKGKVTLVTNIDNKGLANTYIDIETDKGTKYHASIGQVFDHKPKQVKKTDQYGEVTVWE